MFKLTLYPIDQSNFILDIIDADRKNPKVWRIEPTKDGFRRIYKAPP